MGKSKTPALLLFFALFLCSASGLTVSADKGEYLKGETIIVSGECDADVEVRMLSAKRMVFEGNAECRDHAFELSYEIAFSDPAGAWNIAVSSGDRDETERVIVKPVRESQFFIITFLSPSREIYARGEDLNMSVRVTDAGEEVESASVFTWGALGEKMELAYLGEGIYFLHYSIPPDAPTGQWNVVVTAEKNAGERTFGGENSKILSIEKALIPIAFAKPAVKSVQAGETLEIEVKATYPNGSLLRSPSAALSFDGRTCEMHDNNNGFFACSLEVEAAQAGVRQILVEISDEFGNTGKSGMDITVGIGAASVLLGILPAAVVLLAAAFAAWFFALPRMRQKRESRFLGKEGKELEAKIRKLQEDYFEKGSVGKEEYRRRIAGLEAELEEVKKKLKTP
jgi:hypothetical protein